jgi:ketosteroid isomerase-like protein
MKAKLLIPFLFLIAACNTVNKPMTDEQKAAVKDEGSAVVKEFFDAMAVSNLEKLTGLLENSSDYNFIVGGDIYGYDKMLEMASKYLPQVERQTFDTKYEKYVIVSPTCFIYTWHGRNGMYMKTGEKIMMEDYLVTYCFRKHADGWKLFVGHESEKVPLPIDTTNVE